MKTTCLKLAEIVTKNGNGKYSVSTLEGLLK